MKNWNPSVALVILLSYFLKASINPCKLLIFVRGHPFMTSREKIDNSDPPPSHPQPYDFGLKPLPNSTMDVHD